MSEPITAQMKNILDLVDQEIKDATEEAEEYCAEKSVEKLKESSPKAESKKGGRSRGKYARGWRAKNDGDGFVVYNATDWQLTHLLNNGHAIYNRFGGSYGRVNGDDHIGNVEDWAKEEYPRQVLLRTRGLK